MWKPAEIVKIRREAPAASRRLRRVLPEARLSNGPALSIALSNVFLAKLGLASLLLGLTA